jgi:hypothetical protein
VAVPKKPPDLGNNSPVPRALMYIELAIDLSSWQGKYTCGQELVHMRTGVSTHADRSSYGRVRLERATKARWLRLGLREWSDHRLLRTELQIQT